jgi:hypothetical protein
MTEPSSARPVPGPPRPGPAAANSRTNSGASADIPVGSSAAEGSSPAAQPSPTEAPQSEAPSFEDLGQRPVAEHVGVFEAEHARLQRELGTIDQL